MTDQSSLKQTRSVLCFSGALVAGLLGGVLITQRTGNTSATTHIHDDQHLAALASDDCPVCRVYADHRQTVVRVLTTSGMGSGVVISLKGHIVTSAHVVGDSEHVFVETTEGTLIPGSVIRKDEAADLALVHCTSGDIRWQTLDWQTAGEDRVGSPIYVIGHPLGLGWTVTQGVVSAHRMPGESSAIALIQTDAGISPGNSGGPVFDSKGMLIGIVRSKLVASGAESLAFAIPAATVREFIEAEPLP